MKAYYVYWYRLTKHCDPHSQGYIGITNNMERRHLEHVRAAKNNKFSHFYNALNAYGIDKVHKEILHNCTKQEALEFELYYRPEANIAWNMAQGGKDTLASVRQKKVSLYHKNNPEIVQTFESITKASEKLGIGISRIVQAIKRNSPHYGFDGWAILLDNKTDRTATKSIQQIISERITGTKRNKPSHYKGITDRWSDEDKKRISKQHKGKVISEKQKETVKRKNRANHSSCKTVTLVHKDTPDVEHTYHSISEASRQLELPLSRLKSKALRSLNSYGNDGWKITKLGSE